MPRASVLNVLLILPTGGSVNQSSTISIHSRPSAQILGPHTLSKTLHTSSQIICQVDNCGTVKWMQNGYILKERTVNGSSTDVLELNVTEDGAWMCVATRGDLEGNIYKFAVYPCFSHE